MTISTTTNRVTYTGNGVTVAFSFPYAFFAKADLVVIETVIATGVQTTKALTTDYTISGSVDALGHYSSGGTVTAVAAPASTKTWTIYRDPTATQTTDLVENDPMPAESLEAALDYQTMLNQRTRDIAARSLQQPEGDSATIDRLPAKVDRASKYLAFDADGDPVATAGTTGNYVVTPFMETVLDDTTAAAARTTLGAVADVRGVMTDYLQINGNDSDATRIAKLLLNSTHATKRRAQIQFLLNGTTKWVIGTDFLTADGTQSLIVFDSEAGVSRLLIDANGLITLGAGQLKFPATQVPSADANTLDDYEEGTWTPSVGGTATYTTQTGTYTKVGRQVTVCCLLTINAIGSGNQSVISGLPFASSGRATAAVIWNTAASSFVTVAAATTDTASTVTLFGATAATASLAGANVLQNSTTVFFTLTYFTS